MSVNEETLRLLHLLKSAERPLSGVTLAQSLGISRVALWKRFEALRATGYPVAADRSGYRLLPSDKPLPWEFPGEEQSTFHFESLGSTMDEAFRLGLEGRTQAAVVAEYQSAGRGRADRSWQSVGGNLLVTLLLRPVLPVAYLGALGLEALCTLADVVQELYALPLGLKWPNDLGVDGRKVAGVLVESCGPADRPRFYTLGLGLNVHGVPSLDRPVSSLEALGRPLADRRRILALWRERMTRWAASPVIDPARWSAHAAPRALEGVETFDGRVFRGTPLGFDRTGSLLLSGLEQHPIRYGETLRTLGAAS